MEQAPDHDSAETLRCAVIGAAQSMNNRGINTGTSGNVSVRSGSGMLITPSGVAYDQLVPADIVEMIDASNWSAPLGRKPSSEWRFHLDLYSARPEVEAIVHAHPIHATGLAVHGRSIEAFHYMVAIAGGRDVRCARYATFGTQALSDNVVEAMTDRLACLIEHHGLIACGRNLDHALLVAGEVETLAAQYLAASQLGEPPLLSDEQMDDVIERMASGVGYGSSA